MFIELTDHLRCPEPHPEQFLVLLPGRMDGRRVVTGDLGCPVCARVVPLADGIADFGGAPPAGSSDLGADAVAAFLGLSGPGGFVALVGAAAALAAELGAHIPGVRFALVNPPEGATDSEAGSVLRAARLPLKTGSVRGVVLGAATAGDEDWVADAARAVLPGLRIVVEGSDRLAPKGIEVLASAGGVWVGRRAPGR